MKYLIYKNSIKIYSKEEFNPVHILECGQIFSYEKIQDKYLVYSGKYKAEVLEEDDFIEITTDNTEYFKNFFDLDNDYTSIKNNLLSKHSFMDNPIKFGYGIRILKQDIFEMIISFIISANNNIKRIQKIVFGIRNKFGKNMGTYHSFPTVEELSKVTEQDFKDLGAGYRAKYLVQVCKQLKDVNLNDWRELTTEELNIKLLDLMGVGQKVADCIMLFAFGKQDVFPVDTWIEKVYCQYFEQESDRVKIRKSLLQTFGNYAGYAQQYLFYSQRSNL